MTTIVLLMNFRFRMAYNVLHIGGRFNAANVLLADGTV
jgi:hypothetical protein